MSNDTTGLVPADLSVAPGMIVPGSQTHVSAGKPGASFLQRAAEPSPAPQQTAVAAATAEITESREPSDSQYLTTGLPSGCALYAGFTGNAMHVRRFNIEDVLKIYDARVEKSLRMLAEVIGATLDNFSVWDLTVGDFWYLMYWHRLHSYPKSPFIVRWVCSTDRHLAEVREQKAAVGTLEQEMIVRASDLRVVEMDFAAVSEKLAFIKEQFGVSADIMRLGDYVRIVEMTEEDDDEKERTLEAEGRAKPKYRPSDFVLARHAANLNRVHGERLDQRMAALRALGDVSLWPHLDDLLNRADHSVVETYNVRCRHCDGVGKVEVALDALTFLPEL